MVEGVKRVAPVNGDAEQVPRPGVRNGDENRVRMRVPEQRHGKAVAGSVVELLQFGIGNVCVHGAEAARPSVACQWSRPTFQGAATRKILRPSASRCTGEEVCVKTNKTGRTSAGILLWRQARRLEVLLAHQGGPFWVKKDLGHWTIPKGEIEPGEERVAVARREFEEETGAQVPDGPLIELGKITQKSGKLVLAWAVEGDLDPSSAVSNTFDLEWPPRSGLTQAFPEIDRVEWFELDEARRRLKAAQVPFLDRLEVALANRPGR